MYVLEQNMEESMYKNSKVKFCLYKLRRSWIKNTLDVYITTSNLAATVSSISIFMSYLNFEGKKKKKKTAMKNHKRGRTDIIDAGNDRMTPNGMIFLASLSSYPINKIVQDQRPRVIGIIIAKIRKTNLLQDENSQINCSSYTPRLLNRKKSNRHSSSIGKWITNSIGKKNGTQITSLQKR